MRLSTNGLKVRKEGCCSKATRRRVLDITAMRPKNWATQITARSANGIGSWNTTVSSCFTGTAVLALMVRVRLRNGGLPN
jgi:hypothetical protein